MIGLIAIAVVYGSGSSNDSPSLCERLSEIRSVPMKGEGSDDIYAGLRRLGEAAVPCLIDKITDATPMPDPRMAPKYSRTVVGDVAVFVLVRITATEFQVLLPTDVQENYRSRGVYAYFDYVAQRGHRADLQERWREWWRHAEKSTLSRTGGRDGAPRAGSSRASR
jgi:hypothetical protein